MPAAGICHQGAEAELQQLWQTGNKTGFVSRESGSG